jgi:hypothetical protein
MGFIIAFAAAVGLAVMAGDLSLSGVGMWSVICLGGYAGIKFMGGPKVVKGVGNNVAALVTVVVLLGPFLWFGYHENYHASDLYLRWLYAYGCYGGLVFVLTFNPEHSFLKSFGITIIGGFGLRLITEAIIPNYADTIGLGLLILAGLIMFFQGQKNKITS